MLRSGSLCFIKGLLEALKNFNDLELIDLYGDIPKMEKYLTTKERKP